jgi:flagellar biosynthesis GTPase FlhF
MLPRASARCVPAKAVVIAGFAKEGGKLRASGSGFELQQQYTSYKNGPGAAITEEVEDPNNRTFDILYLDDSTLVTRLKSTRFRDPESGRQQTVTPDSDYYLVWTKAGSASVPQPAAPARGRQEEEEEESGGGGGLFGGFGTAMIRRQATGVAGRATVAERSVGAVSDKEGARAAAAELRRQEAEERRSAQQEAAAQRRAEAEERKRTQREEAERRKRAQQEEAERRRAEAEERKRLQQERGVHFQSQLFLFASDMPTALPAVIQGLTPDQRRPTLIYTAP